MGHPPGNKNSLFKRLSFSRKIQPFLAGTLLAVFINIIEEIVFSHPQGLFLSYLLDRKGFNLVPGLLSTTFSFLVLVMFFWLSLQFSNRWRAVFLILFAIPVIVEFGYWKVFGRPFSTFDLATALASPPLMWKDAISIYFQLIVPVILVVYAILLFLLPSQSNGPKPAALILMILVCFGLNTVFQLLDYPTNWGTSLPQFYKTVVQWSISRTQPIQREKIQDLGLAKPKNNIVMIIDESIRSDHLGINGYDRDTTPYLASLAAKTDLFTSWKDVSSGATCSQLSNALLITGIQVGGPTNEKVLDQIERWPTIFDYARAAGYQTYYLDAQTSVLWNGLSLSDLRNLNGWINTREFGSDLQTDQRAAKWIQQRVSASTGNFIVLNKKGVHFLYEDSYPINETIWSPIPTDYRSQPDRVMNAYDNGIRYNVDRFFKTLIPPGDNSLANTIYLYTSDHGQTLFEGGASWLHCNYYRSEAWVPLFILGHLPTIGNKDLRAAHSNIFATLLDLMGLPDGARAHPYAPSLLSLPAQPSDHRFFFSGDGQVIDFDR